MLANFSPAGQRAAAAAAARTWIAAKLARAEWIEVQCRPPRAPIAAAATTAASPARRSPETVRPRTETRGSVQSLRSTSARNAVWRIESEGRSALHSRGHPPDGLDQRGHLGFRRHDAERSGARRLEEDALVEQAGEDRPGHLGVPRDDVTVVADGLRS